MTQTGPKKTKRFWFIQGPGWALLIYLVVAQGLPAINYELGVNMGTQEPVDIITPVGVAFWKGFAWGDLIVYIPLLLVGLLGCGFNKSWGSVPMVAALGITIYWPVTCLAALVAARDASGWKLPSETEYWVVLPLIILWAMVGLSGFAAKPD